MQTESNQPNNVKAESMDKEIRAAMERMGIPVTQELLDSMNGTENSKPGPLATAKVVLQLNLEENPEWRQKIIKLDETHHPKVVTLAKWIEWFIRRAALNKREKGIQIVIAGSPGTGKSHAGKRIVSFIQSHSIDLYRERHWPNPPKAIWIDWARVSERDNEASFEDVRYEICSAEVVVLDDVGSESDRFKSQQATSRLRRVLEVCEHKWLLVNSNYQKSDWVTRFDARVADRLQAMHYLDMTGVPSYRNKLRFDH